MVVLLFAPLFGFSATTNRTQGDSLIQIPVVEELDLLVDGSITPQVFTPNESVTMWMRGIWVVEFIDNSLNFSDWGAGNPLTNGTALRYDNRNLIAENITSLHQMGHDSYDFDVKSDDRNPKGNHITARYTFAEFVPDGLFMNGHTLSAIVSDNQTLAANAIDTFELHLEGYLLVDDQPQEADKDPDVFRQAFGEKALVFPSPLYALGLILLFLAAFWVIYRLVIK